MHVLVLNIVFFVPAVSGASACAWLIVRMLRVPAPPSAENGGTGNQTPVVPAGPSDLARSA
jgi:hypothetical protein